MSQTRPGIPDAPPDTEYVYMNIPVYGKAKFPKSWSEDDRNKKALELYHQAAKDKPPNFTEPEVIRDTAIGFGKGVARTGIGTVEGLNYLTKIRPQLAPGIPLPASGRGLFDAILKPGSQIDQWRKPLEPTNTAQRVGGYASDVATAALPMGAVSKATRAAPLVARLLAQGAAGAGVSAAQGHSPQLGGLLGAAGELAPAVFGAMRRGGVSMADRMIQPADEVLMGMPPGTRQERATALSENLIDEGMLWGGIPRGARKAKDLMDQLATSAGREIPASQPRALAPEAGGSGGASAAERLAMTPEDRAAFFMGERPAGGEAANLFDRWNQAPAGARAEPPSPAAAGPARTANVPTVVDMRRIVPGRPNSGVQRAFSEVKDPGDRALFRQETEGFAEHPSALRRRRDPDQLHADPNNPRDVAEFFFDQPGPGRDPASTLDLGQKYQRDAMYGNTAGDVAKRGLATGTREEVARVAPRAAPTLARMERLAPGMTALEQAHKPALGSLHGAAVRDLATPQRVPGALMSFAYKRALPSAAQAMGKVGKAGLNLSDPAAVKAMAMEALLRLGDTLGFGSDKK